MAGTVGRLAPLVNDAARAALLLVLAALGVAFSVATRLRIARARQDQRALRRRYRIGPATPIRGFDAETRAAMDALAARVPGTRFATTSGSTGGPKRVAYPPARLRAIRRENLSASARLLLAIGAARPVLFILSSLREEGSLASLLTAGRPEPGWLEGLLVPTRYLGHPAVEPLVDRYGATAVRLFLLALADPALLYATNPSTLAVFLREVSADWPRATALARDFSAAPERLGPAVAAVARRVAGRGADERLRAIAAAPRPLDPGAVAPGLRAYCTWDGGHVAPFLEQVRRALPPARFRHVPMYAMSTETLMTLLHFERGRARFLPIAPGVLYEFVPEGAEDRPDALLGPFDLEPGRAYAMVVSDPYGLRRYATDDVFLCRGRAGGLPDLVFLRRRGLAYSFTGEKLTGEQVEAAFAALRADLPALAGSGVQMALCPSMPEGAALPRYRLLLAHVGRAPPPGVEPGAVAAALDRALAARNAELAAKLRSGRLGPTEAALVPYDDLAARLDPRTRGAADRARRTWESQWKLLPLIPALWEGLCADPNSGQ